MIDSLILSMREQDQNMCPFIYKTQDLKENYMQKPNNSMLNH